MGGELLAVSHAGFLQLTGEGDGLAVLVQSHEHRHVLLRSGDAELGAVHHAVEHVGGIQLAGVQLVAHASPGSFLAGCDGQAVLGSEALGGGHDHRGAIGEGNEADLQSGLFRCVRAGGPGRAAQETGGGEPQGGHATDRARNGDRLLEEVTATVVHRVFGITFAHDVVLNGGQNKNGARQSSREEKEL
ncbi:hypothetical protein D3C84_360080 [compost metagenome]